MTQQPLFMESVYDALKAMVGAAGGPKVVGHQVYPAKSPDDARVALLNAINPDRPEKLDPEQFMQIVRMAREADFHAGKQWLDSDAGYRPSEPLDPETAEAEIVRVIGDASETMRKAMAQLDRLQGRKAAKR